MPAARAITAPTLRRRVVAVVLAAVLAAAGVVATPVAAHADEVVTYDVSVRGGVATDVDHFRRVVATALADNRGWNLGGSVQFREVSSGGRMHVVLASPAAVAAVGCQPAWSCRTGDLVMINDHNFSGATSAWTLSLREYQTYVVLHEVGHWLGHGHVFCPAGGGTAPTMQQQSISRQGCVNHVWPLASELATVSSRRGQPIRHQMTGSPGLDGWLLVTGDFDGDGVDTAARFRDGQWEFRAADGGTTTLGYGQSGDHPVVGDWDGDGVDTVGVVRGNVWILRNEYRRGAQDIVLPYGRASDRPVTGDWDGDGRDTIGVVRDNVWILRSEYRRGADDVVMAYGRASDLPVTGDWDGDGVDTLGVVRDGLFVLRSRYVRGADDVVMAYGDQVDVPVVGDWNGDDRTTLGVVRDHRWILRSRYVSGARDLVFDW
ncbi:MAG TPA: DUF3152 domain-containing protein [Nitriliruptoraceae bacterium]|nr:DUF3152 domain-containing protein [Nitriliruptoraceae bacterium]